MDDPDGRHGHWASYVAFALVLGMICGLPLTFWIKGNARGYDVKFILPNGFRGPIDVIVDPSAPFTPIEQGQFVLRVPEDGRVLTSTKGIFDSWHKELAEFENGQRLRSDAEESRHDVLEIITFGSMSGNTQPDSFRLFVGTWREAYAEDGGANQWRTPEEWRNRKRMPAKPAPPEGWTTPRPRRPGEP